MYTRWSLVIASFSLAIIQPAFASVGGEHCNEPFTEVLADS